MKEDAPRTADNDPLAEFEQLHKKWQRCQHKIKKLTFVHEKEKQFQAYNKLITREYARALELLEAVKRKEREAYWNGSQSPRKFEHSSAVGGNSSTYEKGKEGTVTEPYKYMQPFYLNFMPDSS